MSFSRRTMCRLRRGQCVVSKEEQFRKCVASREDAMSSPTRTTCPFHTGELVLSTEHVVSFPQKFVDFSQEDHVSLPKRTLCLFHRGHRVLSEEDVVFLSERTLCPFRRGHCAFSKEDNASSPKRTMCHFQRGQ